MNIHNPLRSLESFDSDVFHHGCQSEKAKQALKNIEDISHNGSWSTRVKAMRNSGCLSLFAIMFACSRSKTQEVLNSLFKSKLRERSVTTIRKEPLQQRSDRGIIFHHLIEQCYKDIFQSCCRMDYWHTKILHQDPEITQQKVPQVLETLKLLNEMVQDEKTVGLQPPYNRSDISGLFASMNRRWDDDSLAKIGLYREDSALKYHDDCQFKDLLDRFYTQTRK